MTTHILFTDQLMTSALKYTIKPITEQWHLDCNNFKGTEAECKEEGERLLRKEIKRRNERHEFAEPHYPNAPHGSIWDY
jgi:hypothetical protein